MRAVVEGWKDSRERQALYSDLSVSCFHACRVAVLSSSIPRFEIWRRGTAYADGEYHQVCKYVFNNLLWIFKSTRRIYDTLVLAIQDMKEEADVSVCSLR